VFAVGRDRVIKRIKLEKREQVYFTGVKLLRFEGIEGDI